MDRVIRVIGFSGKARSGKDTAANFVNKKFMIENDGDEIYHNISFADFLKTIVSDITGWDRRHLYGHLKEVSNSFPIPGIDLVEAAIGHHLPFLGKEVVRRCAVATTELFEDYQPDCSGNVLISPRKVLQLMGTEVMRDNAGEDVWTQAMDHHFPEQPILIADVRFENEARWIKDQGGFLFYIDRPETDSRSVGVSNHASEQTEKAKELASVVINNATSLEDFLSIVDDVIDDIIQLSYN